MAFRHLAASWTPEEGGWLCHCHRDLWSRPFLVPRHPSEAPEACCPRVSCAKAQLEFPWCPRAGRNPARCGVTRPCSREQGVCAGGPSPCQGLEPRCHCPVFWGARSMPPQGAPGCVTGYRLFTQPVKTRCSGSGRSWKEPSQPSGRKQRHRAPSLHLRRLVCRWRWRTPRLRGCRGASGAQRPLPGAGRERCCSLTPECLAPSGPRACSSLMALPWAWHQGHLL